MPMDVLSEILSLTSPMEASRFAVISKGFKASADADTVWDKFLLSDWPEILSRAVSPVTYATKKELYLSLCHSPILLNNGELSFCIEKRSGKKCYMVGARGLGIIWLGNTPWYWDWRTHPESRFSEVAQLKSVCWLEITGGIDTRILSWKTSYGVYLVYKLDEVFYGLESATTHMRFLDGRVKLDVREVALLHLQPASAGDGQAPLMRDDGWMEVEMGCFYNDRGDDGDFMVKLKGLEGHNWKSGLILQGIEFRPNPHTH